MESMRNAEIARQIAVDLTAQRQQQERREQPPQTPSTPSPSSSSVTPGQAVSLPPRNKHAAPSKVKLYQPPTTAQATSSSTAAATTVAPRPGAGAAAPGASLGVRPTAALRDPNPPYRPPSMASSSGFSQGYSQSSSQGSSQGSSSGSRPRPAGYTAPGRMGNGTKSSPLVIDDAISAVGDSDPSSLYPSLASSSPAPTSSPYRGAAAPSGARRPAPAPSAASVGMPWLKPTLFSGFKPPSLPEFLRPSHGSSGSAYDPIDVPADDSVPGLSTAPDLGLPISAEETNRQLQEMMKHMVDLSDVPLDMSKSRIEGMRCTLLPHQVQGVQWMREREGGKACGGILADDMGLGKTVQMLSLIVSNAPGRPGSTLDGPLLENEGTDEMNKAARLKPVKKSAPSSSADSEARSRNASKTTLIIAPLAVVKQWEREVEDKTDAGLKVLIHHGKSRAKTAAALAKYDIVITTYTTASSEWGNHAPELQKQKKSSKAKSSADKDDDGGGDDDSVQVISDSDSSASGDERRGRDVDSSDEDEVGPGRIGVGAKKKKKASATTGKSKAARRPGPSPLFEMQWLRVVLDEAQNIKNHLAKCSRACFALSLSARSKWCLSGTPIQNNVYEVYSLIHFLRIPPFDDYKVFKEKIGDPLKSSNQTRVNWGMKRLGVVLRAIMLRRTKDATLDGKPLLNLPPRTVHVVSTDFDDPEERAFYSSLEERMRKNLEDSEREAKSVAAGGPKGAGKLSQMATLVMLLRLRQACSHPGLISRKVAEDAGAIVGPKETSSKSSPKLDGDEGGAAPAGDDDDDDDGGLAAMLSGLTVAARKCERCQAVLPHGAEASVVVCRACEDEEEQRRRRGLDWTEKDKGSTKVRTMLKLLDDIKREGKGEKTIVFSQFTSFLDLVEPFLVRNRFNYVRYDGSMRPEAREASLSRIRSDASTSVILISFKAGSTGLNLTCCNRVILMDLWWNPQIEEQAFDRSHRLGQTRDVTIYKLSIEGTVEERILKLQEKKRELSRAALEGGKLVKGKANQLSREELLSLFNARDDV